MMLDIIGRLNVLQLKVNRMINLNRIQTGAQNKFRINFKFNIVHLNLLTIILNYFEIIASRQVQI